MTSRTLASYALPGALVMMTLSIAGLGLGRPFERGHDGSAAAHSAVIARNYLRYGLETRGAQVMTGGHVARENWAYYVSQPVPLPALLAVSYAAFGISEAAARVVPLVFLAAFLVALWRLATLVLGAGREAFVLFAAGASPAVLVFGTYVAPDVPALFFITAFLVAYLQGQRRWALAWFAGAVLFGWIGYFLVLAVGLDHGLRPAARDHKLRMGMLLIAGGAFALHVAHVEWSTPGVALLLGRLRARSGAPGDGTWFVALARLCALVLWRGLYLLGPLTCVVALAWAWRRRPATAAWTVILTAFLAVGCVPLFVFRNLYYHHNMFLLYFVPFAALAGGAGLAELWPRRRLAAAAVALTLGSSAVVVARLSTYDADLVGPEDRFDEADLGRFAALHARSDQRIGLAGPWWPHTVYYADRHLIFNLDTARAFAAAGSPHAFLDCPRSPVDAELRQVLSTYDTVALGPGGCRLLRAP